MKKQYFSYKLTGGGGSFLLSLMALLMVIGASEPVSGQVPVEALDGLKIQLTRPNTSGVEILTTNESKDCHYSYDENELTIVLSNLKSGQYRLTVKCEYGTNTYVLAIIDCSVSENGEINEPFEIELPVVKSVSDGAGSEITVDPTPTEDSENPVASGGVYSALEGKADAFTTDAAPTEDSENPVASGGVYTALAGKADGSIYRVGQSGNPAVQDVAKVHGHSVELSNTAVATGTKAVAEGDGTTASGNRSHAEGNYTTASGDCAHAEGDSTTAGDCAHAEGNYTIASGDYSHSEGLGTIASQEAQHVCGKYNVEDTDDEYAMIVGRGKSDEDRKNAFAIDWSGNLVLFNAGTPVVLTPAKLAQLIA